MNTTGVLSTTRETSVAMTTADESFYTILGVGTFAILVTLIVIFYITRFHRRKEMVVTRAVPVYYVDSPLMYPHSRSKPTLSSSPRRKELHYDYVQNQRTRWPDDNFPQTYIPQPVTQSTTEHSPRLSDVTSSQADTPRTKNFNMPNMITTPDAAKYKNPYDLNSTGIEALSSEEFILSPDDALHTMTESDDVIMVDMQTQTTQPFASETQQLGQGQVRPGNVTTRSTQRHIQQIDEFFELIRPSTNRISTHL